MRAVLRIARNSLVVAVRDGKGLLLSLVMPMLLVAILGSALHTVIGRGTISPADVWVLNDDEPVTLALPGVDANAEPVQFGTIFVEDVLGSADVAAVLTAKPAVSHDEAFVDVAAGRAAAFVHIPSNFTAAALAGDPVEIAIYTDPAAEIHTGIVQHVVRNFTDALTSELLAMRLTGDPATVRQLPVPGSFGAWRLAAK